jgi:hypothetical protein
VSDDDMILSANVTHALHEAIGTVLIKHNQAIAVDGWGIRIKDTPYGSVYVERMIFTWRVKLIENPDSMYCGGIGWCYPPNPAALALRAAWAWDGSPDKEPSGWIRAVHDGRKRGEPREGVTQI